MTLAKIITLGLLTLSLGMGLATHGKKRSRQNGWTSLISYLMWLGLLYWCGFFNDF